MATTKVRVSVEEYLALDENPIDCSGYEYIDGEVVPKMAADMEHMSLDRVLNVWISRYIDSHGGYGGPEGRSRFEDEAFYSGREYRLPDVSYWKPGLKVRSGEAMVPPTLAIEIRSPGQSRRSQEDRCVYFLAHGVEAAWVVDFDDQTVTVLELGNERIEHHRGDIIFSTVLADLTLDVDWLFSVLDGIE